METTTVRPKTLQGDETANYEEVITETARGIYTLVQDKRSFGDEKWRTALGMHILPTKPRKNKWRSKLDLLAWPGEKKLQRLTWMIMACKQVKIRQAEQAEEQSITDKI